MSMLGLLLKTLQGFINIVDRVLQVFGMKLCPFTRENVLKGWYHLLLKITVEDREIKCGETKEHEIYMQAKLFSTYF